MTTTVRARQDEFERVAMPHSPSLLRVARQLAREAPAAEDLVQDTLLRAWRSFDQFQTGTNAKAWLFRILFNRFRAVRRNVRSRAVTVSLDQAGAESNGPGQPGLALNELAAVTQALAALSPEHRTVLLLGGSRGVHLPGAGRDSSDTDRHGDVQAQPSAASTPGATGSGRSSIPA